MHGQMMTNRAMFNLGDLTAIVLAGGRSERLGMATPKPLIALGGKLLLARVADTLKSLCAEEILVVRPGQSDDVPDLGIALGMHVVTDVENHAGPLSAISAGLAAATTPLAFVIGADYPFLSRGLIIEMTRIARHGGEGLDAAVFIRHGEWINPLHAVYPVASWQPLTADALNAGMTSPTALMRRVMSAGIYPVEIMTEDEAERVDPRLLSLFDVDTLDDLGVARQIIDIRNYHRVRPDLKRGGI